MAERNYHVGTLVGFIDQAETILDEQRFDQSDEPLEHTITRFEALCKRAREIKEDA